MGNESVSLEWSLDGDRERKVDSLSIRKMRIFILDSQNAGSVKKRNKKQQQQQMAHQRKKKKEELHIVFLYEHTSKCFMI